MTAATAPVVVLADARWLAHRYDPSGDAIHFRSVSRDEHARATFLTDEYLPAGETISVLRAETLAACPPPAPLHFIFHSAFCLSTLLARALDVEGRATTLKEPVILNDIVGWRHRGGDARQVATVLDQSLTLLARPFEAGEIVVVKPSNVVNSYIAAIMAMRPQARVLFVHAPLEIYLGSITRKGLWGRHWVRDLMVKLLRDDSIHLGIAGDDYLALTDLQAAAVGWLAQHQIFAQAIARHGERSRSLDSETLSARPAEAIAALATHFGLDMPRSAFDAILTGPAFATHSKTGAPFSAADREHERATSEAPYADEITKVAEWARVVAANAGIDLQLDQPLIT